MNGYEKRTQAKKEAILQAAHRLFTERGVMDVGISEIAAQAQVSQVSIYNYFGDKHGLAKEVLTAYLDQAIQDYEEILKKEIPFSEKLGLIMTKKYATVAEVSRSHFSEYARKDKLLQQVYQETATVKAAHIYTLFIEQGKKEGAIDKHIPNDAILDFIFSSVALMRRPEYVQTSQEYKAGLFNLFLYGMMGKQQ